jgi:phage terminase large subunit GpA-like protein
MTTKAQFLHRIVKEFRPPPKMSVSQWADQKRMLSAEASSIPGRWKTSLVEFAREIMDCVGDPRVEDVVVMAGAQVCKSEILLNVSGYLIDYDPSPILMVQPTLENAEAFSKDRIAPMLRDTPALKEKVSEAKSRGTENTIKQKMFPGGHLTLIGANSPSGLSSRPIRAVLFDEVDRYPTSAGTEGDPIALAEERTTTFWNRINLKVSTPTTKDASRIEAAYQEGDQRKWMTPCHDCGEHHILAWSNVRWENKDPKTAHYVCPECGSVWSDTQRVINVRKGYWVAQMPFNGTASFHISGLMSPFRTLESCVRKFINAQGNPERLKSWTNTILGETWEEKGARVDPHALVERCEDDFPEGSIPDGVTVLTAGVDVQADRLEYEIVGWGVGHRSWSVRYGIVRGDTSGPVVYQELKAALFQIFEHERFGQMTVRAVCVDSGYNTRQVYEFTRDADRCYSIKGIAGEGKPLVGNPTRANWIKEPVFPVGSHTVKKLVFDRLKNEEDEAAYCHFPAGRTVGYFEQLTAEELATRFHKGFKRQEFVQIRRRNEALDCRCYATAALELLDVDLKGQRLAMEARYAEEQAERERVETKPERSAKKNRTGGFVGGWKNR